MALYKVPLLLVVLLATVSAQVTLLTASEDIIAASSAADRVPPSSERLNRNYTSTLTVKTAQAGPNIGGSPSTSSIEEEARVIGGTSTDEAPSTTSSISVTLLVGNQQPSRGTASTDLAPSQTLSTAEPINTTPCNGHPSFCSRKYSNITHIAAHNSPFVREGNAATNQELAVTYQLQDGIRMLQFPTHWNESEQNFHLCHTSCDILDAGTLETYLRAVTDWLRRHPYDVVTILMTNHDVSPPERYIDPVVSSGLIDFAYIAPKVPMGLEDWPTLQEMIMANTRAVFMLDYEANQEEVPWLHDEFAQMFETPFSPTNREFPCTADRPPADWPGALPRENRMYMANHNLNAALAIGGFNILVPNTVLLNETNAALNITGSAQRTLIDCTERWNRPPNFLLVDYYNIGNFNGSVFEVASQANNVPYDKSGCCGTPPTNVAVSWKRRNHVARLLPVAIFITTLVMTSM